MKTNSGSGFLLYICVCGLIFFFFLSSVGQRRGGIGAGVISPGKGF